MLPWVLSGRGVGGLCGQAGRLLECVESGSGSGSGSGAGAGAGAGVVDVGFSLLGRSVFEDRGVVLGVGREGLLDGLGVLAGGGVGGGVVRGRAVDGRGAVFLFPGQGSQRVGMGRELYGVSPVFRSVLDVVCGGFDGLLDRSLREVMFGENDGGGVGVGEDESAGEGVGEGEGMREGVGLLDRTVFTQPALFAVEVALYRLLEACGVCPGFLLGHSVGELAAAYVAGVFSLEDACRLVAARGGLMDALPGGGAMVAIEASEDEVAGMLDGGVVLGAVNGPCSVVVSGDEGPVLEFAEGWRERGRRVKRLRVSHAFHSHRMDPMLEEFASVAQGVSFNAPSIPIVSNVTGELPQRSRLAPRGIGCVTLANRYGSLMVRVGSPPRDNHVS